MGDLNARTASESPDLHNHPPHTSPDPVINPRGRALLELATRHGLYLVNGTCPEMAHPTSFSQHTADTATSVIDYCLASRVGYELLAGARVCEPADDSDHAPLHVALDLPAPALTAPPPREYIPRWT